MTAAELRTCSAELRDVARSLDEEAMSLSVDQSAILNAYRVLMFTVQRVSHGAGFACLSTGIDEWEITKK